MSRSARIALLFAWLAASLSAADPALRLVIILGRHGVRPPTQPNATLDRDSAQPWPDWPVPPGWLTPHGEMALQALGRYYRQRYAAAGLLTGEPARDLARVTVRADSEERTLLSARVLATALLGGVEPPVLARAKGASDPLFSPVKLNVGRPDAALARAALLGRIGNNPQALLEGHAAEFAVLRRALWGATPLPPGRIDVLSEPALIGLGKASEGNVVAFEGALRGTSLADDIVLEFAEGLPMSQVGWGRVRREDLDQLMQLGACSFDLTRRTFYVAQVQGSNLLWHIEDTIEQAVQGAPIPGAVGAPSQRLVILLGHDTNIINVGGLLNLSWLVPGAPPQPVLPGGALVFELRGGDGGGWRLRIEYVAQTLDQIRELSPLSLAYPPAVAPIFIPECSGASPGYDAPWAAAKALIDRVVARRFTVPGSS